MHGTAQRFHDAATVVHPPFLLLHPASPMFFLPDLRASQGEKKAPLRFFLLTALHKSPVKESVRVRWVGGSANAKARGRERMGEWWGGKILPK